MNHLFTFFHLINPWLGFLKPLWEQQAYFDPGSGSLIIQLLIAALLGGAILIKAFWGKISGFFRKVFSKGQPDQDDDQ
jgi:hypothetical protein